MCKTILKRTLTYLFYLFFSFGVGYLSLKGGTDYVADISKSIIPILMALMSLYAAISGQLITHLKNSDLDKIELKEVVNAMERNVVIEALLLAFSFVYFASYSWFLGLIEGNDCLSSFVSLFRNALVCFDFLYFVYVVYDSTVGLYHLLKK